MFRDFNYISTLRALTNSSITPFVTIQNIIKPNNTASTKHIDLLIDHFMKDYFNANCSRNDDCNKVTFVSLIK